MPWIFYDQVSKRRRQTNYTTTTLKVAHTYDALVLGKSPITNVITSGSEPGTMLSGLVD
jgi:hypothetical protein